MSIKKGSRTIASSVPVTEWGSIDGTLADQADLKSALDSKAGTYSPTFTGTPLAPTAPVGSGNNQIATTKYVQDALLNAGSDLPDQTGQSGKFLTTDGQLPSWANVDALPEQSGQSGKYLTTNGTSASWGTIDDSNLVHKTGTETITGQKIIRTETADNRLLFQVADFHLGDDGSTNVFSGYKTIDADGTEFANSNSAVRAGGTVSNNFWVQNKKEDGTLVSGSIGVYAETSGSVYAVAPELTDKTDNSNKIVTTSFINGTGNNLVHKTGDETIAGVKTFTSAPIVKMVQPTQYMQYTGIDKGTAPSSTMNGWIGTIYDKNGTAQANKMAQVYHSLYANGASDLTLDLFAPISGSTTHEQIALKHNGTNFYTYAPTPTDTTSTSGTQIATTGWVNTKINGITLTSGNDISIDSNKAINYTGTKYYRLGTRSWTYAQWIQYCERGVTTNISASYDVTGIKVGDLVTVEGICTDRNNCSVLAWGIVTTIDTNITTTFIGINFQDSGNVVHTTGNEEVSGVKTFNNNVVLGNGGILQSKVQNIDDNTTVIRNLIGYYQNDSEYAHIDIGTEGIDNRPRFWSSTMNTPDVAERQVASLDDLTEVESYLTEDIGTKQDITTAVNYDNITNCITEIPQDIKLELNNGTLTLKAGSKVYVPNGFESDGVTKKFDVITIENDLINSGRNYDLTNFMYIHDGLLTPRRSDSVYSGPSAPASPNNGDTWYDTTNNIIKYRQGSVWETNHNICLPFAITKSTFSSSYTSIEQVFNGFGYIGSTVFALSGVKGLTPNGRNEDGTLKNIEFTTSSVLTYTNPSNVSYGGSFVITNDLSLQASDQIYWKYNQQENLFKHESSFYLICEVSFFECANGKITSFTPKTTFHALDYNDAVKHSDKVEVVNWGMPDYANRVSKSTGTNYTAEKNGYLWLYYSASGDTKVTIDGLVFNNAGNATTATVLYPVKKGSKYSFSGGGSYGFSCYFVPAVGG